MTEEAFSPPTHAVPARRHMGAGAFISVAVQLTTLVGATITSVVIARVLGPSGTGTYAVAMTLLAATVLLSGCGLPSGITYVTGGGGWSLRRATREAEKAAVGFGLVGAALGLGFYALTADSLLQGISTEMAAVTLGALPFVLAWTFLSSAVLAAERYETYGAFQLAQVVFSLVAVVGLTVGFGTAGAITGLAASYVFGAVASHSWLVVTTTDSDDPPTPGKGLGEALRFGLKAWGADLLQLLNYRLDLLVLNAFVIRADVGYYSVAVTVTSLGWILPGAMQGVLFPRASRLDAAVRAGQAEDQDREMAVTLALRHTVMFLVPTAVILVMLLVGIVPLLYGQRFHPTIGLGLLLLPGVLALGVAKVMSAVITGRGFPIYSLYNSLITAPITIGLYVLLIPRMHAEGAALASTGSYIASTVIAAFYFRRVSSASLRAALIPSASLLGDYVAAARSLRSALALALPKRRGNTSRRERDRS